MNFYAISFLSRPGRIFRILGNFLRGRETSKMESFLQESLRKLRFRRKKRQLAEQSKEELRGTA